MQKSLIIIRSSQEVEALQIKISKNKKRLMAIIDKVELLDFQMSTLEEKYRQRVGRLQVRDNNLDIEIAKERKILELREVGLSREDALAEISQKSSAKEQSFNESIFDELFINFDSEKTTKAELKKIWKKLLHVFHPDLEQDKNEKKRRTEIVKRINHAYKTGDIQTLKNIEEKEYLILENKKDTKLSSLQENLIELENAIIRWEKQLERLKVSEWYIWVNLPTKKLEEFLNSLEAKLTKEITHKEKLLNSLRRQNPKNHLSQRFNVASRVKTAKASQVS